MIIVIDYDVGNVRSVCNAFGHIGCEVKLSCKSEDIKSASGLVLPGVAAFGYAVNALGTLAEQIKETALSSKPLLGICVGYQMLFETSTEHGRHEGLGLIGGNVIKILTDNVIPHMGWNSVVIPEDTDLLVGLGKQKNFYFAHSYYANIIDCDVKTAYTNYGFDMPASVQKANIYGTQFHPEKSGRAGLKILSNFAQICERFAGKC
ncbi:MAG: imidazole glycerol phosphate synthase subunit HisH [Sedimentisphaerales bacterium]|nr:imidazole glycerol phosphate synthase subunit HisH [Sedimentisphaerales bacterium]